MLGSIFSQWRRFIRVFILHRMDYPKKLHFALTACCYTFKVKTVKSSYINSGQIRPIIWYLIGPIFASISIVPNPENASNRLRSFNNDSIIDPKIGFGNGKRYGATSESRAKQSRWSEPETGRRRKSGEEQKLSAKKTKAGGTTENKKHGNLSGPRTLNNSPGLFWRHRHPILPDVRYCWPTHRALCMIKKLARCVPRTRKRRRTRVQQGKIRNYILHLRRIGSKFPERWTQTPPQWSHFPELVPNTELLRYAWSFSGTF